MRCIELISQQRSLLTDGTAIAPQTQHRHVSTFLSYTSNTAHHTPVGSDFEAMETVNAEDATAVNNLRKYFKKEQYAKALELCDKSKPSYP
jgi:hypothetical protein